MESYGAIGDLRSVALVGMQGSIDGLCFPPFGSPRLFAARLDGQNGGRFKISLALDDVTFKQFYWPATNVVITRFLSGEGVGEIADFRPVGEPGHWHGKHQLVCRVTVGRGSMGSGCGLWDSWKA